MEEKENNQTKLTWEEVENWIGTMMRMHENSTLASETIQDLKNQSKSFDLD